MSRVPNLSNPYLLFSLLLPKPPNVRGTGHPASCPQVREYLVSLSLCLSVSLSLSLPLLLMACVSRIALARLFGLSHHFTSFNGACRVSLRKVSTAPTSVHIFVPLLTHSPRFFMTVASHKRCLGRHFWASVLVPFLHHSRPVRVGSRTNIKTPYSPLPPNRDIAAAKKPVNIYTYIRIRTNQDLGCILLRLRLAGGFRELM